MTSFEVTAKHSEALWRNEDRPEHRSVHTGELLNRGCPQIRPLASRTYDTSHMIVVATTVKTIRTVMADLAKYTRNTYALAPSLL